MLVIWKLCWSFLAMHALCGYSFYYTKGFPCTCHDRCTIILKYFVLLISQMHICMKPFSSLIHLHIFGRMQDIELMHMRYALESAVFALGAMEKCVIASNENYEVTLGHLKHLNKHLDAIHNKPRKVYLFSVFVLSIEFR